MAELQHLLQTRNTIKKRKPEFIRQDAHKKPRLSRSSWRKPKGLHSKIREQRKGKRPLPEQGFRSPAEIRGFHPKGLKPVLVNNIKEIEKLKGQKNIGIILGKTGNKKKIELLEKAIAIKLPVLNIKNPQDTIQKIKNAYSEKIKQKQEATAAKEKKTREEKTKKEKESIEQKIIADETKGAKKEENEKETEKGIEKEVEKKERDKVLSRKE